MNQANWTWLFVVEKTVIMFEMWNKHAAGVFIVFGVNFVRIHQSNI